MYTTRWLFKSFFILTGNPPIYVKFLCGTHTLDVRGYVSSVVGYSSLGLLVSHYFILKKQNHFNRYNNVFLLNCVLIFAHAHSSNIFCEILFFLQFFFAELQFNIRCLQHCQLLVHQPGSQHKQFANQFGLIRIRLHRVQKLASP
jgi:hypothetical protein